MLVSKALKARPVERCDAFKPGLPARPAPGARHSRPRSWSWVHDDCGALSGTGTGRADRTAADKLRACAARPRASAARLADRLCGLLVVLTELTLGDDRATDLPHVPAQRGGDALALVNWLVRRGRGC